MATELTHLTIAEARDGLSTGDFSSVELIAAHNVAVEKAHDLNAFVVETPELALDGAKASDDRRAAGDALGAMDGIPIAMKDLFCTEGVQTTAGSRMLEGFRATV